MHKSIFQITKVLAAGKTQGIVPLKPSKENVTYLMAVIRVEPIQLRNVTNALYPLDTKYLPCKMGDGVQVLLQRWKHIENMERHRTVRQMGKEGILQTMYIYVYI